MDEHFDDWLARFNQDAALLFIREAGVYNRMVREDMVALIKGINKSNTAIDYSIGNEGSRVIYANYPYWADQGNADPFNEKDRRLCEKIEKLAKEANCDEYTLVVHLGQYKIRMWWD